jgi:ABC-type uncharacterized transport system permease subunit
VAGTGWSAPYRAVLTSRICDQRAYPTSFALDLASPLLVGVTELALVCGTVIFAGLFVCAISLQFFLVNDAELTSSFAYGGSYATSQPASIVPTPLRIVFGQLVPVAFTAYLPTLAILHLPGPPLLPSWAVWCTPVAVAWVWLTAMLVAMGNPALPRRRRLDVVSRIYLSRR